MTSWVSVYATEKQKGIVDQYCSVSSGLEAEKDKSTRHRAICKVITL